MYNYTSNKIMLKALACKAKSLECVYFIKRKLETKIMEDIRKYRLFFLNIHTLIFFHGNHKQYQAPLF